ncbi:ATP-binding protein [Flavobacterium sp.]|uniref:tetratricopeptide repeat-containing sensor histidine kinase n=1 Tax=Flavobacterium sp. TaxID=239 RepID=UPI002638C218|nr:ATP-binding protein [Flavobacterium sp.]MDG2433833.1 ATP-binding protein [Flavobacterium sp.]
MKKKYFIFTLFVFLFACSKKKEEFSNFNLREDSLSIYFELANDLNLPITKRENYNDKDLEIVLNHSNDSLNRVNLFKVANRYYNISNWKNFSKTVRLVLENAQDAKDTLLIAKAYNYLGDYYDSQGVYDTAYQFYYKAEKMYERQGDKFNWGKTLINKATLQFKAGDFLGCEKSVGKVLRIIQDEKKANNIYYNAYNLLGITYGELGEFDNALSYNGKALSVIDDEIIPVEFQSRATSFNNIGFLYLNSKNYSAAKSYFQKGLLQKKLISQKPTIYAMLLDNLAYSKFKMRELDGLPDLFYKSIKLKDSLKLTTGIFVNKIHLAEYFAFKNDTIKALVNSQEALNLARTTKVSRDILVALKQLSIIDPQNASTYTKEYIQINEKLQKAERTMGEKFSRIEYETDQIKDQNSSLEDQNRNLLYALSILTIVGLFIYIIKTQKTKNKVLLYKQQQQQANEDIYNLMISQQNTIETSRVQEKKRVAQELHDGVLGRMFGVRMNLDSLNKIQDDMAIQQRDSYLSELKNIEQDIREISHDLNREKSELINNFVTIVDNMLEEQRKTFPAKIISTIDSSIKWDQVKNSVKINLYRIIQESLQNCNKYANASVIKVELKKKDDTIVLLVKDDGIGFDIKTKKKGIGLNNMISRTNECDGQFDVSSIKGQGSTIIVTIPTEQKQIPL